MPSDIQEHVRKAFEYLLQEYKYFQEFKNDLEELSAKITSWKGQEPVRFKELFRDLAFIGRAERRSNRFLIKVEEDIKRLLRQAKTSRSSDELEKLEQHLEIGGRIKQELDDLLKLDPLSGLSRENYRAAFNELLDNLLTQVNRALQWIISLSNDLRHAQELVQEAAESIGPHRWEWLPIERDEKWYAKYRFQVFIYDFSKLPTGTHKFLKAVYALKHAHGNILAAITAGNYGLALKVLHQAQYIYKELHLFLDKRVDERIPQRLSGKNVFVHLVDLNRGWFGKREMEKIIGKQVTDITHIPEEELPLAYKSLNKEFGFNPKKIFCPVGSGELLSVFETQTGEKDLEGRRNVFIYGVVPPQHPFTRTSLSFSPMPMSSADALVTPWINPMVLRSLLTREVTALEISEEEILQAHQLAKQAGYDVEVSASVGFAALLPKYLDKFKYIKRGESKIDSLLGEQILIVSTGNGHKYFGIK